MIDVFLKRKVEEKYTPLPWGSKKKFLGRISRNPPRQEQLDLAPKGEMH